MFLLNAWLKTSRLAPPRRAPPRPAAGPASRPTEGGKKIPGPNGQPQFTNQKTLFALRRGSHVSRAACLLRFL